MASFYDSFGGMAGTLFAPVWAPQSVSQRTLFHTKAAHFHNDKSGRDRIPRCQVPGCHADLSTEKPYSQRKRICSHHMQAAVLEYPGHTLCRYCFQCAKVEPIQAFDGTKRSCRQALQKRKLRTITGPLLQAQHSSTAAAATCAPACFKSEASDCALHKHLQQQALHLQQQAAAAAELQQIQTQQQMLAPAHSMGSGQVSAQLATLFAAAEQAQAMLAAVRAQVSARQQLAAPGIHSPDAVISDSSSRTASPQGAAASLAAAVPVAEGCSEGDAQASFTAATGADADTVADTDFESFLETLLTADVPACNFQAPASGLSSSSSGQPTYLPASLAPFGPAASLTAPTPGFVGTPLPCVQAAPCAGSAGGGPVGSGFAGLGAASSMVAATSSGSTGGVVGPGWNAAAHCGAVQQLESLNEMLQQVHSRVLAIMQTSQAGAATY